MLAAIFVPLALFISFLFLVAEAKIPAVGVGLLAGVAVIIALEARSLVPKGLGKPFNASTPLVLSLLILSIFVFVIPYLVLVGLYYYKRSVVLRGGAESPQSGPSPAASAAARTMPAPSPAAAPTTVRQMPAPASRPIPPPVSAASAKPPPASSAVIGDE